MSPRPQAAAAVSRRRAVAIGAQVVIVGGIALLVTLTLLQPDAGDPLFGISTPEEADGIELRQDPPRDRAGDGRRKPGDRRRPLALVDGRVAGAGGAGAAARGLATSVPPGVAGGGAGEGLEAGSPSADQYSDAVARLTAKLD